MALLVNVWVFLFSVDCKYEYICEECSATCGEATKECTIRIIQEARHGGKKCPPQGFVHEVTCDDLPDCIPGKYHRIASGLVLLLYVVLTLVFVFVWLFFLSRLQV